MKIAGTAILVTGANRGLGRARVVGDATDSEQALS
jgi:NAD(P)-dependent dehydrogenase (short-subunit alcohol dehydrogenase family)